MEIYKDLSNAASKEFEKLLTEDLNNRKLKEGEIITGVVSSIGQKHIFIDISAKSEGAIPIEEFKLTKEIDIPKFGTWDCSVYKNNIDKSEHIAFVKGDIDQSKITPVRVHVVNVFQDLVGIESSRENLINKGFKKINDIGFGVFIFIRDTNQNVISNNLKKINNNDPSKEIELREYGVGAQILLDIGVRNIKLISDSKSTLLNIEGYNLEINERVPLVD